MPRLANPPFQDKLVDNTRCPARNCHALRPAWRSFGSLDVTWCWTANDVVV